MRISKINSVNFQARIKANKENCMNMIQGYGPISEGAGLVSTATSSYSASGATIVDQLFVLPISDTRSIPEAVLNNVDLKTTQELKDAINNYTSIGDSSAYNSIFSESISAVILNTKGADKLKDGIKEIKSKNIPT